MNVALLNRWSLGLILVVLGGAAPVADAALNDPNLPGASQYDEWTGLTTANYPGYPGFPGSGAWPAPMGSNASGSGDAAITKVTGNAFPSTSTLYIGGFSNTPNTFGATLAINDATPVDNLANVVLQIQIGEASGYDFHNDVAPVLNYNAGSQSLVAATAQIVDSYQNGTFTNPETNEEEPLFVNTWLLQWDLSGVVDPITSFAIQFSAVQHAQVYAVRLDQSDQFVAVPEPVSLACVAVGLVWALRRRR